MATFPTLLKTGRDRSVSAEQGGEAWQRSPFGFWMAASRLIS